MKNYLLPHKDLKEIHLRIFGGDKNFLIIYLLSLEWLFKKMLA